MQEYHFTVDSASAHKRLDLFLSEQALSLTRSQIKRLIDLAQVKVNQHPAKPSRHVHPGDVIEVQVPPPQEANIAPQAIPLDILYEDHDLIVVNKPAGIVVHPGAGNYTGTLVNALLYHCSFLSGIGGVLRPGIVHRLDKGTSGVLVVAKTDQAHQHLARQFKNRTVKKVYKALVYGTMDAEEGVIDSAIGRHYLERKKMSTRTRKGKSALTSWKVVRKYQGLSLLSVTIHSGRTHQIRVHLSSRHHPLIGDRVYGGNALVTQIRDETLRAALRGLSRPFLHAYLLGFTHPRDSRTMELCAPLPEDLVSIITMLEHDA